MHGDYSSLAKGIHSGERSVDRLDRRNNQSESQPTLLPPIHKPRREFSPPKSKKFNELSVIQGNPSELGVNHEDIERQRNEAMIAKQAIN